MKNYKLPPQEFIRIMHELNGDYWEMSNWESSPEWRIFNAGRRYEIELTMFKLRNALCEARNVEDLKISQYREARNVVEDMMGLKR